MQKKKQWRGLRGSLLWLFADEDDVGVDGAATKHLFDGRLGVDAVWAPGRVAGTEEDEELWLGRRSRYVVGCCQRHGVCNVRSDRGGWK